MRHRLLKGSLEKNKQQKRNHGWAWGIGFDKQL